MSFRITSPRRYIKKKKTANSKEVLRRLEEFLNGGCDEPVEILCGFWKDQQNAITYQELRQVVLDEEINNQILQEWSQDYSILVAERFKRVWQQAIVAGVLGQPILDGLVFEFNTQTPGILNWISERGAEFVTACTQAQKDAIAGLLSKKMRDSHTVDELARMIRPCIGLTEGQAKANARYYDSIVANLRKEHPRMKTESIRRKARDAAAKYAERQHRERAMTIAQTESAFAYNRGADEGVRQAQEEGLLGTVRKRWSTSGDDAVCEICASLEGMEIEMNDSFSFGGKLLFAGQKMLPPAHPRCACAVEYIEVEKLLPVPEIHVSITETDSFREYSDEEIQDIANQTENIISKHINIPSRWSGKMYVSDSGYEVESTGQIVEYGKLWDCSIVTKHETAPGIIMHEQIHARSASYFEPVVYIDNYHIEESCVQYLAQEISKVEKIEIIESQYDDAIEILHKLRLRLGYVSDYEFAKDLIDIPLVNRINWISEKLYDIISLDETVTIEDYQKYSAMIDSLAEGSGLSW